jgi:putative FmdB family regulatory protein
VPIYEYACAACRKEFEKYVATATVTVVCPACESARVKRRLSLVGVKTGAVASPIGASGASGGCCGGGCGCH